MILAQGDIDKVRPQYIHMISTIQMNPEVITITNISLPNSKQQYFSADINNIPFKNDRYPDQSIVLTGIHTYICATNFWLHPHAMCFNPHTKWFKLGHITFSRHVVTVDNLLDDTKKKCIG